MGVRVKAKYVKLASVAGRREIVNSTIGMLDCSDFKLTALVSSGNTIAEKSAECG